MSDKIPGLKLIQLNSQGVNEPDDPSFPYLLHASFSPPEFMIFAFIGLFGGTEELRVRGMTREAIDQFIAENSLRDHPRLRKLEITGPEGIES